MASSKSLADFNFAAKSLSLINLQKVESIG